MKVSPNQALIGAVHQALIGAPINRDIYIYDISHPGRPPLTPFKTNYFHNFQTPLGVPDPLEPFWLPLCQILTLGNALGPLYS